jgi:hypothetical protein
MVLITVPRSESSCLDRCYAVGAACDGIVAYHLRPAVDAFGVSVSRMPSRSGAWSQATPSNDVHRTQTIPGVD